MRMVISSSRIDPFPDVFETTLVYAGVYNYTSTLGVPVNRFFTGNGLFDPDVSGGGRQPYAFDTFCGAAGTASLYKRYAVQKSTYEADAYVATQTAGNPVFGLALRPVGDAGATGDNLTDAMQRSRVKWGTQSNPGAPHPRFADGASTSEILGVAANAWTIDDTLQGDNANNPTRTWYWQVTLQSADQASTISGSLNYRIEYHVRFISRNRLTDS